MTPVTDEDLSAELFQSRTSMAKVSKEHFEQTPLELQRTVRMDRLRQLLLQPANRKSQGLNGVGDCAESIVITSHSHFAHQYQQHFGGHPRDRITNALKRSKKFNQTE